jgi:hypothetical protein
MKKKICIVDAPEQGQGVYALAEGRPAVRLDRDTGGLEQLQGAWLVGARRLSSGLIELELEFLEKNDETNESTEPAGVDSDASNLWLRAGYLWGMTRRTEEQDDRMFLFRAVRSLVAFARSQRKLSLEKRWSLEEIKAAWLRAQDGGPAGSHDEGDLENSWDHVRGALTGEAV